MRPVGRDGETLYAALAAIRAGSGSDATWRDVQRFIGAIERDEDRVQEAMIRVHRAASGFVGTSVGEAVRWVRTIVMHRNVDVARRRKRDPLAHVVSARDDDDRPLVERLAAPADLPNDARLHAVGERVIDHVTRTAPGPARLRVHAITMAQAAWLRLVHQMSAEDLVAHLPVPPASTDALYKWVERGRAVLLDAVATMEPDDELEQTTLDAIAALCRARRKDAGKPRVARRKKGAAT